jgi:hypothetical protein
MQGWLSKSESAGLPACGIGSVSASGAPSAARSCDHRAPDRAPLARFPSNRDTTRDGMGGWGLLAGGFGPAGCRRFRPRRRRCEPLVPGREDSRHDPESSRRDVDRSIQRKRSLGRTADRGDPLDAEAAVRPTKVDTPAIPTRVEQPDHLARHGVRNPDAARFGFVAAVAGQPQVASDRAAAARGRNQVVKFHRHAKCFRCQAIAAAVAGLRRDAAPERFGNGRFAHV